MTTFLVVLRPVTPDEPQRQLTVRADHLESQPNGSLILYNKSYGLVSVVAIFPLDTVVFAADMNQIEIIEKYEKETTRSPKVKPVDLPNLPSRPD